MADQLTGWGRGTWSEGGWDEALPVIIDNPQNGWNEGAWGDASWGGIEKTVPQASGAVGSVTVDAEQNAVVNVTGVAATAQLGEVFNDTGSVEAIGQVGQLTIQINVNLEITGVEGTGEVDSVTALASAQAPVVGVEGTSQLGNVFNALTGVEASGELGNVVVTGDSSVTLTGVEGAGEIGNATVSADATVSLTGVEGAGEVDEVTISADAIVEASSQGNILSDGIVGFPRVGQAGVQENQTFTPTGVESTAEIGDPSAITSVEVALASLVTTAPVGSVIVEAGAIPEITGVQAAGEVGIVTVWGRIVPAQDPGWTEVTPAADNWTEITPTSDTDWTDAA